MIATIITKYACDYCHTESEVKEDIEKCEQSHVNFLDLEIMEISDYDQKKRFPVCLILRDKKSGAVQNYRIF